MNFSHPKKKKKKPPIFPIYFALLIFQACARQDLICLFENIFTILPFLSAMGSCGYETSHFHSIFLLNHFRPRATSPELPASLLFPSADKNHPAIFLDAIAHDICRADCDGYLRPPLEQLVTITTIRSTKELLLFFLLWTTHSAQTQWLRISLNANPIRPIRNS